MNTKVTWRQALDMCEELEHRRRPLNCFEKSVVDHAYTLALGKREIPHMLSKRLEMIYFKSYDLFNRFKGSL